MKQVRRRSDCPINFSLETFGDIWSLLIVRDMVYFGKRSYSEFLESNEQISTNILASRLGQLEQNGILIKRANPLDKRKDIYTLTEKGLDLIPVLLELANWGAHHDADTDAPQEWIKMVNDNRSEIISRIRDTVRQGGSIFVGEDSVIHQVMEDSE